jgi:hypothetical protein
MNYGSKQFNNNFFLNREWGTNVRPSKDIRGQMTAIAKRGQTSEGATVRRAMCGYPADHERLT